MFQFRFSSFCSKQFLTSQLDSNTSRFCCRQALFRQFLPLCLVYQFGFSPSRFCVQPNLQIAWNYCGSFSFSKTISKIYFRKEGIFMHRSFLKFWKTKCFSSKLQNIQILKLIISYEALKTAIVIEMGKKFSFFWCFFLFFLFKIVNK